MMISPKVYVNDFKTMDYHELIKERDRLIRSIRSFEKKECAGDRTGPEWHIQPSPEVVYQCDLEYLAELCQLMRDRYNEEYVWGDKELSTAAKRTKKAKKGD